MVLKCGLAFWFLFNSAVLVQTNDLELFGKRAAYTSSQNVTTHMPDVGDVINALNTRVIEK